MNSNDDLRPRRYGSLRAAVDASIERLEGRLFLATDLIAPLIDNILAPDLTSASNSFIVTVDYSDDQALDPESIDEDDLAVTGPAGTLNVTGVSTAGTASALQAAYTVAAPSGGWLPSHNGTYEVRVKAGEVTDAEGNAAATSTTTFDVNLPDSSRPDATISADNITAATTTHSVVITYEDDGNINLSTIGINDISVSGPAGDVAVEDVTVSGSGGNITATYRLVGPGGSWTDAHNGEYTVTLAADAVTDAAGNGIAAKTKKFNVGIDATGPSTQVSAPDFTGGNAASYAVTVTYSDPSGFNSDSASPDDLIITGPGATSLSVSEVSTSTSDGGEKLTVKYTVAPPGGTWDEADNGQYEVVVKAGAVTDARGNPSATGTNGFTITVPRPDTVGPQATLTATDLGAARSTHTVRVVYTDDVAIDEDSIGESDISVSGPGGEAEVTDVDTDRQDSGRRIVATYTIRGPGGGWDNADNGAYVVTLNQGAVADSSGNETAGVAKNFTVNIPAPDTQAPAAAISVGDVTEGEGTTHTVSVTYTDDRAVRASTIGISDITVTGPGGPLSVTSVSSTPDENAGSITATYTIAAPGGVWDPSDNGNYTIAVKDGSVTDTSGNNVASMSKTFNVSAGVPDGSAPAAAISGADVTTAGGANHAVVVTYTDDAATDPATLGSDDLTISGPAGVLPVSAVVLNSSDNGKTVVATYTFSAPTGGWTYTHNGVYTVTVNADAVRDGSGKGVNATSATFRVAVESPEPVDTTFGGGSGNVNTAFVGEAVTTQPDGMILVAGRLGDVRQGNAQAVLQRLNSAGDVDTTFGQNGKIVSTGANEAFFAVAMQGDKILVAGTSDGEFLIARYDLAGNLDPTFGNGGRVLTDLGSDDDAIYGLALAADGKIIVAGGSGGNFAFFRTDANGVPDLSFGQAGKQLFDLGTATDVPGAVAVQADGTVIAVGSSGPNVAVVRLRADGEADAAFSGDGLTMIAGLQARQQANFMDRSQALALQADGKILVANHTPAGDVAVARLEGSGNLDGSFGTAGIAVIDFAGDDDADAIIIQDTGEILVVGTSYAGGMGRTTIAALNNSGNLIESFGQGGKLVLASDVLPASREVRVGDIVIRAFGARQSDGRIVVGTSNQTPTTTTSALKRLIVPGSRSQPTGSLLGNFGIVDGRKTRLQVTDVDGTVITFTLKGGTGSAFQSGDAISLVINDEGRGAVLGVKARGGNGRVEFADVTVNGSLKKLSSKTGDLAGTLSATAFIGKLALGNVNGTIAAGGSITSISAENMTNARLLAGTGLGGDRRLGGAGADADSYAGGSIGKIKVRGSITSSLIGAGLNPIDGTFANGNDIVVGGPDSLIKSIVAKGGADSSTTFTAGAFGKAKLGTKVTIAEDERFKTL